MLKNIFICLFVCCLSVACVKNQQCNFYVLDTSHSENQGMVASEKMPTITVGPITLPGYLDSEYIFIDTPAPKPAGYARNAAWGETLVSGVTRVLCTRLGDRLGNVAVFPSTFPLPSSMRLIVNITHFSGTPSASAMLSADWTLVDKLGNTKKTGHFNASERVGDSIGELVKSQGILVQRFGDALSTELRGLIK